MSNTIIRLGGVPEHFNLPIHQAIENGEFESRGVDLQWTTYHGGTGEMTKALRADEVDACILLTEGVIKDIILGNQAKIVSGYVNTPLIWGVHTGASSVLQHHSEVYDKQYAISRFGSGSHLMAMVDATVNDLSISQNQFTIVGNLQGALQSLTDLDTQVFYWEKYTTKPYVDKGILRRVGEFVTPWPCFVIAANQRVLDEQPEAITRVLRTIHDSCDRFMQSDDSISQVASRYDLEMQDVERWYHSTEWAIHGWVSDKMLKSVVHNLRVANIIGPDVTVPELVWRRETSS